MRIRSAILDTLERFPDARVAVLQALVELRAADEGSGPMNLDGFIHAIDGVDFARRRLGFDPDAKQSLVLAKRVR